MIMTGFRKASSEDFVEQIEHGTPRALGRPLVVLEPWNAHCRRSGVSEAVHNPAIEVDPPVRPGRSHLFFEGTPDRSRSALFDLEPV
jgi:hypothetical protein